MFSHPARGKKEKWAKTKKDDDDIPFVEASPEPASIILPTIAPVAETQATPSYTRLIPEVHELFENTIMSII